MENNNHLQNSVNELYAYIVILMQVYSMDDAAIKEKLTKEKHVNERIAEILIEQVHKRLNEIEQQKEEERRKSRKQIKIVAIVIAFIILSIGVYNLPYFKEMRAYDKVIESNTIEACGEYMNEYPEGRHAEDVMYLKAQLDDFQMRYMVDYLEMFPKGVYSDELNKKCDKIWDDEIAKYEARDKKNDNPQAVAYFTEMLKYMKSHRVNEIIVNVNPKIELTDWSEYTQNARDFLEMLNKNSTKSLDQYMVSLKDNFTKDDQSVLTALLIEGVQKSLNKIFDEYFISVVQKDNVKKTTPKLIFNYSIKSQEIDFPKMRIPDVWSYTSNGVIQNYLIGISINFNAHFTIPNSSTAYDYSEKGEPEDDINNIEDIKDGYRIMTSICFAKFSNKMSKNLGLAEAYFQDEDGE